MCPEEAGLKLLIVLTKNIQSQLHGSALHTHTSVALIPYMVDGDL